MYRKLKDDYGKLLPIYKNHPYVKNLIFEDDQVCFTFQTLVGESLGFTVSSLSDAYPSDTVVFPSKGDSIDYAGKRLDFVINDIVKKQAQKFKLTVPNVENVLEEPTIKSKPKSKGKLEQSQGSDDEMDDSHHLLHDETLTIHPNWLRDVESIKTQYGKHSIGIREFPSLQSIHIDMLIDQTLLSKTACAAWKVDSHIPISLRFKVDTPGMYPGSIPKIEIFQTKLKREEDEEKIPNEFLTDEEQKKKKKKLMGNCGVSHQLTNILDQFMRENWEDVNGKRVNSKIISENKKTVEQPKPQKFPSAKELKKDPNVKMLCEMGFDAELCYKALQIHNNNVEEAANALLTNPESVLLYNEEKMDVDDVVQPSKSSGRDPKLVPPRQYGILVQNYGICPKQTHYFARLLRHLRQRSRLWKRNFFKTSRLYSSSLRICISIIRSYVRCR